MAVRRFSARPNVYLLSFLLLLITACGGGGDKESEAPASCETSQQAVTSATYNELWTKVFAPQCGACHGNPNYSTTVGGPDMRTSQSFYASVVNVQGQQYEDTWDTFSRNRESCFSQYFIRPGSANASMVTAVLDPSLGFACVIASHKVAPQNVCITDANLAKLKEWINAGAAQ